MTAQRVSGSLLTSAGWTGFWLVPVLMGLSGCAQSPARSLARAWNDAPKIRWSRVPEDPPEKDQADSQIAANTPSKKTETNEPSVFDRFRPAARGAGGKAKEEADRPVAAKSRTSSSGPYDPFQEAEHAAGHAVAKKKSATVGTEDSAEQPVVSAREKLRKTLSDDSRRSIVQTSNPGDQEQLRLRIESLMNRAKAHCKEDQWVAARRAAELAQSLADSSGLEFDPDDERPIELLTFITGRLEAESEAARQRLADMNDNRDADAAESPEDSSPSAQRKIAARSSRRSFPEDFESSFDPYTKQADLAESDEESVFGPSMVVLETPSFDDTGEVSPIAYSRTADRLRNKRRFALTPEETPSDGEVCPEEIPGPPDETAADPAEIEIPGQAEAPEIPEDAAPSPPWSEPSGPSLEAIVSPSDAAEPEDPEDIQDLRPAAVWPRWMPLSALSALTGGFCLWLWRRRYQSAG